MYDAIRQEKKGDNNATLNGKYKAGCKYNYYYRTKQVIYFTF